MKYLFFAGYLTSLQYQDYIALNGTMTEEWSTEKDLEGIGCGTILEFAWRDWGKQTKNTHTKKPSQNSWCPGQHLN
jgi:hypothetical protein